EWAASAHARSATGKHFRNLYDGTDWHGTPERGWSLLKDHPDGAGVCASCHAPSLSFTDPAAFDLREVKGVAAQGVHCDFCHKIPHPPAGVDGLTHGRFGLRLQRPREGQLFFGPLDDVDRGEDAYAPVYKESRYCASCHEGVVFGVRVYGTYSEWLDSPARRAGKQCQDCHMTPTGTLTNIAPGRGGVSRDPATLSNHRFFQGSKDEMLRRSVRVAVEERRQGDAVRVQVTLRADAAGHRVPTGFVDRHLLLVVEGRAGEKVLDARTGPRFPPAAGERYAGQAGRLFGKLLEDEQGRAPAPFWRPIQKTTD